MCVYMLSRVGLFATVWTVVRQAHFHRIFQARILEWLPFPTPGDLPNPGIKPVSPALQADSLPLSHQGILVDYISQGSPEKENQ